MSRRFPTGSVTLPTHGPHYEQVLTLVMSADEPYGRDEFLEAYRETIRNPDTGDQYGESWVRRTVADLVSSGFLRRQPRSEALESIPNDLDGEEDVITLWPTGKRRYEREIDFESFYWRSLKRGWVLEANAPEKIEAVERVTKVLIDAETPLSRGDIEARLREQYDYEFSSAGIRGYPNVLLLMGAITETEDGKYETTERAERYLQKFRDVDLFRIFERWMQREGPTGDLPRDTIKRDMAKYYMYRESGGWGKQTGWIKSFWRDYVDQSVIDGETSRATLRRAKKYVEEDNRRGEIRDQIREKHGIETNRLRGLSTDLLERIVSAPTPTEARRIRATAGPGISRSDLELLVDEGRNPYEFPPGFSLYDWQQTASNQWFTRDGSKAESGIAQVVTGAGKTVMALDIIRRWLAENDDGVVTVVVPTKVLMQQWLRELVEKLNVPMEDIGWAGDGTRDSFEERRVIVAIVNTAVKDHYLRETLSAAGDPPHFLIADECHRYTSDVFSNIFEYPREASLGLSATPLSGGFMDESETAEEESATESSSATADIVPETEDSEDTLSPEDQHLLEELGGIYHSLTYDEALNRGLIPPFEVNYVRFDLLPAERREYEGFTRKISDAISKIEARYGDRLYQLNGGYDQKLHVIMNQSDGPVPAISDYFEYTKERRDLVANAIARQAITLDLLERALDEQKKSIVFQERIYQLEQLVAPHEQRGVNARTGERSSEGASRQALYKRYPQLETIDKRVEELFDSANYKPVMYHSGHSRSRWNDFAMEWFRDDGFANTMLSVKALIEGVDVPSADQGIIRVSSSSLRQRIQTLGRVLRTGEDASKRSKLYVLYARDTVDERLFQEYDWDDQLANAEINHYEWVMREEDAPQGHLEQIADPLPSPDAGGPTVPDIEDLAVGDEYTGPRRGLTFSVDSDGRPFRTEGGIRRYITNDAVQAVADLVYDRKGGGTVTINEANHMVTMTDDGPIFLGVAPDPDSFEYEEESSLTDDAPDTLDFM